MTIKEHLLYSSPAVRLVFGGETRLTLAPRARVSPGLMPPNSPYPTGSDGLYLPWRYSPGHPVPYGTLYIGDPWYGTLRYLIYTIL